MMHIITENLVVQNNWFVFAYVRNGYLTENNSTFTQNKNTYGGVIFGSDGRAVAKFTNSELSKNVASDGFGGVISIMLPTVYVELVNIKATENSA